ncbi:hypothetical protein [Mediterraneibacter glycyrrhizinilyticus]|uniref:hypothetical protein n=1 Tax=Mediterraneibacter glycyrrhizinilyticus TaxID=342942 RepID=UPI001961B761|nr:hypothetical protein [Mediterraneibacter glycyrrhizinilyticus]
MYSSFATPRRNYDNILRAFSEVQQNALRRDSSIPLRFISLRAIALSKSSALRRNSSIPLRFISLWAIAL